MLLKHAIYVEYELFYDIMLQVCDVHCATKCVKQLQIQKFEMKDIVHSELTIHFFVLPYQHQSSANVAGAYRNCYFTLTCDSVRNT